MERANGLIMSGIKPRLVRSLKESNTHWVEELDSVLWGLRTMPNRTTGYTPFFMVYGSEAVLPCDIIHDSPRVRMYEEREAEIDRQDSLTTRNMSTCDHHYWSLNGHSFPFVTFL